MTLTINLPGAGRRRLATLGVVAATVLLVTGCTTSPDERTGGAEPPSAHVHGVAIDPADGRVYVATHDGLLIYDETGATPVGPQIDLMGFAIAGPRHFYASGHPGPGVDLPEPVGLIESTDGGVTWTPVSRQGESDFHTLTASGSTIVGFDGAALLATSDGSTWRELEVPVEPFALAGSPDGRILVATSQDGPVRSIDAGASWVSLEAAPLLQVVAWAGVQSVVGITPNGVVAFSEDGGESWTESSSLEASPHAVGASMAADGTLRILAVTDDGVLESVDRGANFAPLAAN